MLSVALVSVRGIFCGIFRVSAGDAIGRSWVVISMRLKLTAGRRYYHSQREKGEAFRILVNDTLDLAEGIFVLRVESQ